MPAVFVKHCSDCADQLALVVDHLDAHHDRQLFHARQDAAHDVVVEAPHGIGDAGPEGLLHRLDFAFDPGTGVPVLGR